MIIPINTQLIKPHSIMKMQRTNSSSFRMRMARPLAVAVVHRFKAVIAVFVFEAPGLPFGAGGESKEKGEGEWEVELHGMCLR